MPLFRTAALGIAMLAAIAAPAAATDLGKWQKADGLDVTWDLPAPKPQPKAQSAQQRQIVSGHKFQLQDHRSAPPGTPEIARPSDGGPRPYHTPKSFQIISAGKDRR